MAGHQELEAVVRILVAEMMGSVASGQAPDALRDLDSMQAVRIARLIAPRVLAMVQDPLASHSMIKPEEP